MVRKDQFACCLNYIIFHILQLTFEILCSFYEFKEMQFILCLFKEYNGNKQSIVSTFTHGVSQICISIHCCRQNCIKRQQGEIHVKICKMSVGETPLPDGTTRCHSKYQDPSSTKIIGMLSGFLINGSQFNHQLMICIFKHCNDII